LVALEIEARDEVIVARLSGELDLAGAPATGEQIAAAVPTSARGLVIDLSGLDFMDSSGVAMLFKLSRMLGGRRQQVRVVAPSGATVARVLDIVEFDRATPVHSHLDGALSEIG
jgi:anti-sigma B factor antagonist